MTNSQKCNDACHVNRAGELRTLWDRSDGLLRRVRRYTRSHFISPFNAITQDMVDLLVEHDTQFIHSFDVALHPRSRKRKKNPHPKIGGNFGGYVSQFVAPASRSSRDGARDSGRARARRRAELFHQSERHVDESHRSRTSKSDARCAARMSAMAGESREPQLHYATPW